MHRDVHLCAVPPPLFCRDCGTVKRGKRDRESTRRREKTVSERMGERERERREDRSDEVAVSGRRRRRRRRRRKRKRSKRTDDPCRGKGEESRVEERKREREKGGEDRRASRSTFPCIT